MKNAIWEGFQVISIVICIKREKVNEINEGTFINEPANEKSAEDKVPKWYSYYSMNVP